MTLRTILILLALSTLWACKSPKGGQTPGVKGTGSKEAQAPSPAAIPPSPAVTGPEPKSQKPEKQSIMTGKADYGVLAEILDIQHGPFAGVFRNPDSFNLQIIYTQIDRDRNNRPSFKDHVFMPQPGRYFYPASTVKMPVAILALQRLRELNVPGFDRNSAMVTGTDFSGQTPVLNDPTTPDGRPTIAQYIRKIFLVSDNDAYNRLYEFLGPHYINKTLHQMGYSEAEIIHRLELSLTEEENRHTNPIRFFDGTGAVVYEQKGQYNAEPYSSRADKLGKGYIKEGNLVSAPMDFSRKNRIGLHSLHAIMKSIIFPEAVPVKQRFFMEQEDYRFIRQYMSAKPSSVGYPPYDSTEYYDTYCKFLLFGADRHQRIPAGMKVFNKVGDAYGHLLDVAYVADAVHGVEFMLSVVAYCNKDGILNDNRYDYDEIGFPLFKYIGQRIYFHERARPKTYKPNLDWIKSYD